MPGDISSAAYFIVAALVIKSSDLIIENVGVNPTRTGLIDVLKKMGANIEFENAKTICGEEIADIHVKHSKLRGVDINETIMGRLIDEIPIIAVAAAFAAMFKASAVLPIEGRAANKIKSDLWKPFKILSRLISFVLTPSVSSG